MDEENKPVPPVAPGIFSAPQEGPPQLLGGYCRECHHRYFSRPKYCKSCLGTVDEIAVGRSGTIYSFTLVRTKPPLGLPSPYSVGFIDLDGSGFRVFSLFDSAAIDQLQIGLAVELAVESP